MLGEGGQGLPRELAGDGQAAGWASESSLWSDWKLLQEGDREQGEVCRVSSWDVGHSPPWNMPALWASTPSLRNKVLDGGIAVTTPCPSHPHPQPESGA